MLPSDDIFMIVRLEVAFSNFVRHPVTCNNYNMSHIFTGNKCDVFQSEQLSWWLATLLAHWFQINYTFQHINS